ncbi:NAD-dependent succinate-semialdehyde dehydrogenase [Kocuria palustris]|uniref:NAD-dependent succinate-semialdehyde dehydrogenase n=1 Tax=Kocuria palustris TaxID=71999 RepID=UPI0011A3D781|nr:NAD-dependent succinate-semialdehyde dehydrogenase [Kocuria palustris]
MTDYAVVNPADNQKVRDFEAHTDDQIRQMLDRAQEAQRGWAETPMRERAESMAALASLYRSRSRDLASTQAREMGKPLSQGMAEMELVASIYDYYAQNAESFTKPEEYEASTGGMARVELQPTGTILGIMPWNYPHYQVARLAAPNLMLGNTILLKHAAMVPESAQAQEDLMREAGFPEGVYQNLFASNEQISEIVIPSPVVQGVSVTGSERAGKSVAATAGANLKKVVLELGGSDAFIVLDDQDIERVAKQAVAARVGNNGQACTNSKRFIVVEEAYDAFVKAFAQKMADIEFGDPQDEGTFLGPLVTTSHRDELAEQLKDAVDKGATVEAGGHVPDRDGAWIEATVLTGVTPDMRAYSEELFGPIGVVYKVPDAAAAIELANDSPFGLGGIVFGSDVEKATEVAEQIDTGMVYINGQAETVPDLPFGGVKRSGVGRELGPWGMREFANVKLVHTPTA